MFEIGQQVILKSGLISGMRGLNQIFLSEQGYFDGNVPIIKIDGKNAKVRLPSGYELWITKKDVI